MPVTTPHRERDPEDLRPEVRQRAVPRVLAPQAQRFEHRDQHPEPHRQDGEQVVEHDREAEMPTVSDERVGHVTA